MDTAGRQEALASIPVADSIVLSTHLGPCHRQAGRRSQIGLLPGSGYFCYVGAQQGGCSQPGLGCAACLSPSFLRVSWKKTDAERMLARTRWRRFQKLWAELTSVAGAVSGHSSRALVLVAP